MIQAKFSVTEKQVDFLSNYRTYGFKDKSSMLREAIEYFRKKIETERLKISADLYSRIYIDDNELNELTETAIDGWPE